MSLPWTIHAGATAPTFRCRLPLEGGGYVDFNNDGIASTTFRVGLPGAAPIVSGAMVVLDDTTVEYRWTDPDTDVAGRWYGEVVVTYDDGTVRIFPERTVQEIHILDPLTDTP